MKKVIIFSVMALSIAMGFTSCLKDESLTLDTSKSNNVTEFGNTGTPATLPTDGAAVRFAIDLGSLVAGDTTSFNINVDYAGAKMAPEDIQVTVDIDESLLPTYNSAHEADDANVLMPIEGLIKSSFPQTITIPKGQQFGQAKVKIELPSDFDFNVMYGLPLKITKTSVGEVSGNFGTAIYSFVVRNLYDGIYKYSMDGWFSSTFTEDNAELVTTGATTVQGNLFYYYSNTITYNIDPATNVVSVKAVSGGYAIVNYPDESKYDPATKSMHVVYDILGGHIVEDFEYVGPR